MSIFNNTTKNHRIIVKGKKIFMVKKLKPGIDLRPVNKEAEKWIEKNILKYLGGK